MLLNSNRPYIPPLFYFSYDLKSSAFEYCSECLCLCVFLYDNSKIKYIHEYVVVYENRLDKSDIGALCDQSQDLHRPSNLSLFTKLSGPVTQHLYKLGVL